MVRFWEVLEAMRLDGVRVAMDGMGGGVGRGRWTGMILSGRREEGGGARLIERV